MFSTLRNRFGIPGVISVIALVFAMFGGAYAASNSSGGGKATTSAKAKKGPRGPKGATGPAGPAGAQGPAGAAGAKGSAGANGEKGATGLQGEKGEKGEKGLKGEKGEKGEPGLTGFTETLPTGKTETGSWFFQFAFSPEPLGEGKNEEVLQIGKQEEERQVAISFPIPTAHQGSAFFFPKSLVENEQFGLEGGTTPCKVEGANPSCIDTGCSWKLSDAEAKPESHVNGTLCVFNDIIEGGATFQGAATTFKTPSEPNGVGHGPSGAYMRLNRASSAAPKRVGGSGTWAVTGN